MSEIGGNNTQIGNGIRGNSWVFNQQNQNMTLLPANMTKMNIERSALELHYRDGKTRLPLISGMPIFDTVSTTIHNIGKPMVTNKSIGAIVTANGAIIDTINNHR